MVYGLCYFTPEKPPACHVPMDTTQYKELDPAPHLESYLGLIVQSGERLCYYWKSGHDALWVISRLAYLHLFFSHLQSYRIISILLAMVSFQLPDSSSSIST